MPDDTDLRRPGTVTAAAVILYVCSGLPLVFGLIALSAADLELDEPAAAGIILLMAFALVTVALATKVLGGSDGARTTVIVLLGVSAALQVLSDAEIANKIIGVGLNLLVIGLLAWGRDARDYFARHRDTTADGRPGIVVAAAVILYISASVTLFVGLLPLFTGFLESQTAELGLIMLIGLAQLAVATGVFRGSRVARIVLVVVLGISITLNAIEPDENSVVNIGLNLLVIGLVLCAGSYFRGSRPNWWATGSRNSPEW